MDLKKYEFFYENQGYKTFLVHPAGLDEEMDTMTLGMLTNNKIPGLAPAMFAQMDSVKHIRFDVSAKVPMSQFFSGPVNKKRLMGVLSGIVDAVMAAEEYMIDPDMILLDPDYIFSDVTSCETELVCLPVVKKQTEALDLGKFFKNVIFNTQFDQTEDCGYVAQILNYLNSTPNLSLYDFKQLLDSINKPHAVLAAQQCAPQPMRPAPQPVQPAVTAPAPASAPVQVPSKPQPIAAPVAQQEKQPAMQSQASNVPNVPNVPNIPNVPQNGKPQFAVAYPAAGHQANAMGAPKVAQATPVVASDEKPMSMFYLLQHYNKENAALYKAQQEAKKANKASKAKPAKQPAQPKVKPGMQAAPAGFAVPGKPAAPAASFAVPGKPAAPAASFAVPGQQPVAVPAQRPAQPVVKVPPQTPAVQQPVQRPVPQQPSVQQPAPQQPVYQQPAAASRPINFGETTVLGAGIGETTVLSATMEPTRVEPHLIRTKNNEKINLNKPVFRIGKERSYVDYFIGDNTAVSRSHANIINRDGEFFVVDTNSTNHTYVNGTMIQSSVEVKLTHGAKLRFANEEFEFKMH